VTAFDVGAVDYLLKPIEAARLRKALDRAREQESRRRCRAELLRQRGTQSDAPPLHRLALPTRQGVVLVSPLEVTHAVLDGELVTVYTRHAQYLSTLSLQDLESRLSGERFARVHRRALVNLEHVVRLDPTDVGGYTARTSGGHAVEVSRQAARGLRRRLGLR
jgi:two-component system, LytTR family, response regulator